MRSGLANGLPFRSIAVAVEAGLDAVDFVALHRKQFISFDSNTSKQYSDLLIRIHSFPEKHKILFLLQQIETFCPLRRRTHLMRRASQSSLEQLKIRNQQGFSI